MMMMNARHDEIACVTETVFGSFSRRFHKSRLKRIETTLEFLWCAIGDHENDREDLETMPASREC